MYVTNLGKDYFMGASKLASAIAYLATNKLFKPLL